jgi:ATP-dependent helicase HepA
MEQFRERLLTQARGAGSEALEALIAQSRLACQALAGRLAEGRDRLLALHALGPARDGTLVQELQAQDEDPALDRFLRACFEHFFIPAEAVAPRTWQLGSAGVLTDAFPGLPSEGLTCTTDRQRALIREDLQFLTWDHPLVTGALDLILGSQDGNCCFAWWPEPQGSALYLEAIFLLACLAPPGLQVDRFLPPTPLRVVVDARGRALGQALPAALLARHLRPHPAQPRPGWLEDLLPGMLKDAQALASGQVASRVAQARQVMNTTLGEEQVRLAQLGKAHDPNLEAESQALTAQRRELDQHLGQARLRLDALRLIHRGRA